MKRKVILMAGVVVLCAVAQESKKATVAKYVADRTMLLRAWECGKIEGFMDAIAAISIATEKQMIAAQDEGRKIWKERDCPAMRDLVHAPVPK